MYIDLLYLCFLLFSIDQIIDRTVLKAEELTTPISSPRGEDAIHSFIGGISNRTFVCNS